FRSLSPAARAAWYAASSSVTCWSGGRVRVGSVLMRRLQQSFREWGARTDRAQRKQGAGLLPPRQSKRHTGSVQGGVLSGPEPARTASVYYPRPPPGCKQNAAVQVGPFPDARR